MEVISKILFILIVTIFLQSTAFSESMHDHASMKMNSESSIVIDPTRLQSIGVTYERATVKPMEKIIRTVGYIEPNERMVSHIHVKFDGWIEKLFINYTGQVVKKGEPLFSVYSPDLVSAQQEFLLALHSKNTVDVSSALQASRQKLLFLGISEEQIDQLMQTGMTTKTLAIESPIDGTVIKKEAVAGMKIDPTQELYTIANLSQLWIQGDIYEYELPYIHVGQQAIVTLSYLPNESFKAILHFISPVVDQQTRTIKARFQLDNKNNRLKPGMYANVEIKIHLGNKLLVPKDAILQTGERAVVFIYLGNGKIEWRNVTLGASAGNQVEILKGINEGDEIITSANFLIDSESQLKAAMGGMKH